MNEEISSQSNNKRIAKNTLLLYFRMLLTMGVSLYTVRIVLNTLGVVDYGIYNVVGGIVVMFSFLSNTMASASQRFFAFELGRNNYDQLKKTFSMTMMIYILIAVVILILAETVGLWFLNTQMTIPDNRMSAANWIYQFSILSFMMTMFTIPYNAAIIAHERMNVYAYVSIIEVILKLAIVYLLIIFSYDKLKLYALLVFGVTTFVTLIYRTYSIRQFKECKLIFLWDKRLFREIVGYSGWNLFGALAGVFNSSGINIILNMFFGPIVNTARGIAFQVNSSINQFVQNFMTATRPQITKYYASRDLDNMMKLVFQSAKYSFLLLFIISMPILLETNFIFSLWLGHLPDYVVLFTRLVIIGALIDSLSYPLMSAAQATGNIRLYQFVVGGIMLLNLPLSYLILKLGYPPESIFWLSILNSVVTFFVRLIILKNIIQFSILNFLSRVITPIFFISVIAYIIPILVIENTSGGVLRFVFVTFCGLVSFIIALYFIGLSRKEKEIIYIYIDKKIKKRYV